MNMEQIVWDIRGCEGPSATRDGRIFVVALSEWLILEIGPEGKKTTPLGILRVTLDGKVTF